MEVCVARELHVAKDQKDKEDAIEHLNAMRQRTIGVSKRTESVRRFTHPRLCRRPARPTCPARADRHDRGHLRKAFVALEWKPAPMHVILSVLAARRHSLAAVRATRSIPEFLTATAPSVLGSAYRSS